MTKHEKHLNELRRKYWQERLDHFLATGQKSAAKYAQQALDQIKG